MIFITGGTGLVGSHLLFSLVRKYGRVKALKRQNRDIGNVKNLFAQWHTDGEALFSLIEWQNGDIADIFSLEQLLKGVEIVYHCAAIVSFDSRNRQNMLQTNVRGTANLVNAALINGVKRFCHVSSNSALGGSRNGTPVTEESSWIPGKKNSVYSESKFFSEVEVWRGAEEGLEVVVVQPSIIIGQGKWGSGSTSFFPVIYRGLKFYPVGRTGFVDVRDVVDAIMLITGSEHFSEAKGHKYLISSENLFYKDFLNEIAVSLGKPGPSVKVSALIMEIGWRVARLYSCITGKSPFITREMAASASSETIYDGSAITRSFGFRYRPVSEAIRHTADSFLREKGV